MRFYKFLFVLLLTVSNVSLFGSHIRAADFSSVRISDLRYRITLAVYTDYETVSKDDGGQGSVDLDVLVGLVVTENGVSSLENTLVPDLVSRTEIVTGVTIENIYEFDYDFPATNSVYRIGFNGSQRNAGIKNITPSGSEDIYIEELFFVDANSQDNGSPVFSSAPVFNGATNRLYTFNSGGIDPDGDSVAYEIVTPKSSGGVEIGSYVDPDDERFGVGSDFSIDPFTGIVSWDTPLEAGEYNVAIRMSEFRNGIRIGYVIRDMQILIEDSDNRPPVLYLPQDTCIAHGAVYTDRFFTSDPNEGDSVTTSLGGGLEVEGAFISNVIYESDDSTINTFMWTPSCNDIGVQPTFGVANAIDDYFGFPLSASGTWEIQVNGESPELSSINTTDEGLVVGWEDYSCPNDGAIIEVFRFECDTSNVIRSACTIGVPEDWGVAKVGEVDVNESSFLDDGSIGGLISGVNYFYVIAVKFGSPSFGESYASNILSSYYLNNMPIITQASFDKENNDQTVNISWEHVLAFDSVSFESPYTYNIISEGNILTSVPTDFVSTGSVTLDTFNFNTKETLQLELIDGLGETVGVYDFRFDTLSTSGSDEKLLLNWGNGNSWIYPDSLFSDIYIFKKGEDTLLIDSVRNGIVDYEVLGLQNGDTVCSYIDIPYVYCLGVDDTVYQNFTNTSCSLIQDVEPPCPPLLEIELVDCLDPKEGNSLEWVLSLDTLPSCNNADVAVYNIYSENLEGEGLTLIDEVSVGSFQFFHESGEQLFCYEIEAVDSTGNISARSNLVCQDFCGSIVYPNVFTPNGDGINDELLPISAFDGLADPILEVYNRWGQRIFVSTNPLDNPWVGENSSVGVYYIEIKAQKAVGEPGEVRYKGWVQLIR